MSPWGWQPAPLRGIWRHGARWARPVAVAAPWLMVGVLVLQTYLVSGSLTREKGVLFELPDAGTVEGVPTSLVALLAPSSHDTLVIFDDARYSLADGVSSAAFADQLAARAAKSEDKALLVLADRRVACGEIMKFAALAKMSGVQRILFANKSEKSSE